MGSEKLGRLWLMMWFYNILYYALPINLCECAVAAESNNGADDDVDDD